MSSEQSQQPSPAKNWLAGGRIPGLPWVPVAAQMHDHAMTVAGVPAATYYRDAETFVGAFTDVASYYGLDVVMPEADIYNFELEAMGGTMIHGENAMPTVDFREPLVREPKDLHFVLDLFFHESW